MTRAVTEAVQQLLDALGVTAPQLQLGFATADAGIAQLHSKVIPAARVLVPLKGIIANLPAVVTPHQREQLAQGTLITITWLTRALADGTITGKTVTEQACELLCALSDVVVAGYIVVWSPSSSSGGGICQEGRAADFMQLGCAGEVAVARQGCHQPCAISSCNLTVHGQHRSREHCSTAPSSCTSLFQSVMTPCTACDVQYGIRPTPEWLTALPRSRHVHGAGTSHQAAQQARAGQGERCGPPPNVHHLCRLRPHGGPAGWLLARPVQPGGLRMGAVPSAHTLVGGCKEAVLQACADYPCIIWGVHVLLLICETYM